MKQQVLALFPHIGVTGFALVLFFGLFIGMLIWVFRKSSRGLYDELSRLPLEQTKGKNI
jgi:cbb3-type cytochrome oxidase subunit 3